MNSAHAEKRVNLGHFFEYLVLVSFGETSRDDNTLQLMMLFQPAYIDNIVYGFLLRAFDKRACIDYYYIGIRFLGSNLVTRVEQVLEHYFGITEILRASERYKSDFCFGCHMQLRLLKLFV